MMHSLILGSSAGRFQSVCRPRPFADIRTAFAQVAILSKTFRGAAQSRGD
jgi:hypothetical protein